MSIMISCEAEMRSTVHVYHDLALGRNEVTVSYTHLTLPTSDLV